MPQTPERAASNGFYNTSVVSHGDAMFRNNELLDVLLLACLVFVVLAMYLWSTH